jgi:hypothetical protein
MHAAHVDPLQSRLQQSVSALQFSPSLRHGSHREPRSAEHVSPAQHESGVLLQPVLSAAHAPPLDPQVPCALQTPPQHSAFDRHGAPFR